MTTAVLFIIFNKPETTQTVFEAIRLAKPKRLYIAADGARENKYGEKELCEQTRKIVQNVDWDCEVKTLFQKENLGCGKAPSRAISWFFEHEEMGIILEDDCLPHQSFFKYCEDLLEKYKNDEKIGVISGNNFQKRKIGDFSYYFSDIANTWGWATWARSWNDFRLNVNELDENLILNEIKKRFPENKFNNYWIKIYKKMKETETDIWDYQFYFSQIAKGRVFIDPNVNLVSNIGFDDINATHTFDKQNPNANIPVQAMEFPLKHPMEILVNREADKFLMSYVYLKGPLFKRIVNKIRRIFNG